MKKLRTSALCLTMILVFGILAGCGNKTESWAYNHEPEKEIISFWDNGKAVYKDVKYTYTKDDTFINLTKNGETISLRYEDTKDGMLLYETSIYTADGAHDGILGTWRQEENHWSYKFTEDGMFNEDGFFGGHFAVDENAGTIKLMYEDPLQDTILYYTLEGDNLTVAYPWGMVPTETK